MKLIFRLFLLFAIALSAPALAQMPQFESVSRLELVSGADAVSPGDSFDVGVRIVMKPGWHTYWKNPGDAGLPPQVKWQGAEIFEFSAFDWPLPTKKAEGPLTVYAYEDAVLLPVVAHLSPDAKIGDVLPIEATVEALVCKDICIPQTITAKTDIKVEAARRVNASNQAIIDAIKSAVPEKNGLMSQGMENREIIELNFPWNTQPAPVKATFFPSDEGWISNTAEQTFTLAEGLLTLHLPRNQENLETPLPSILSGTLRWEVADGSVHAQDFSTTKAAIASAPTAPKAESVGIAAAILLALLGGLVLNAMPCVFPVLSLKCLALVRASAAEKAHARAEGLGYTLGILLCFGTLAGVLIALQQAGSAIGWGFQLQSPGFVVAMCVVIFLVGLNLRGVFELPVLLGDASVRAGNTHSFGGSMATGALATLVATPCTAPFMATAIGAALAQPPLVALVIFLSLGLGLALPFLLLSWFPSLLRWMPKPGAWMETMRHILAWPMFATVVWLLWVLWMQVALIPLGGGIVLCLGGVYAVLRYAPRHKPALVALFAALAIALPTLLPESMMHQQAADTSSTVSYSAEKLDALRKENRAVFVDATAAWCITCQVNRKVALDTEETHALFAQKNIVFMEADWTRRNPEITDFLKRFGAQGVPLYVYFPPDQGAPRVLPQLLTPSIVRQAIDGAP